MPDLIERLRNRRESVYDYATQGAEWQDDALCSEAASRIAALEKENAELRKALETIRDYPPVGGRRTEDGYPMEVVYDEYAYRRIVDTYRLAARLASTERTEGK